MATVLVTGGAGYIGAHAAKALARAGHTPVVYDNLSHGYRDFVRWGPLVEGDVLDRGQLDAAFARYRPEGVLHFAGLIDVNESVQDPALYWRINVAGSLTLVEAMLAAGCHGLVFSSTCAVYGAPQASPIDESLPIAPISPYGATKAAVERLLADACAASPLRAVALRYFNAAGADAEGEIGEAHVPETHLIPRILAAALDPAIAIRIYGTDYATPDGTAVRDYIHVEDLADAHVAALGRLADGEAFGALNLGTGRGRSVREVIAVARRITGARLEVQEAPRRDGDQPEAIADPRRARARLGWQARHTDIDAIVGSAWAWHRRHGVGKPR